MNKYEMVATTLMGLEGVLAEEVRILGGEKITELKRAVRFYGDDALLYKANMALRTALKVLVPIDDFVARDEDELYRKIKGFPWEDIFSVNQTFVIDAVVNGYVFNHSKYVALKSKDAIADRFRGVYGRRPSVDTFNADISINLYVLDDKVSVSLNSSGMSLDRRGYRRNSNEAPINEVLAAGIVLMTGWEPSKAFLDPMAGSGTFSIEAALKGTNTPPNLNRSFSFQNWVEFDNEIFEEVKSELAKNISEPDLKIYARDILTKNIDIISQNAEMAGMEDHLSLKKEDFFVSEPKAESGIMVINPPYGERMKISDIEQFYKNLGDVFKQKYAGFEVWIISSDFEALKAIGLKSSSRLELMNGGLKARLLKFELYRGSRRD
jgi:putative N6-adenine-specific DNA methylase